MPVTEITSPAQFIEFCKEGIAIVDFFATWCGPCKRFAPQFDELSENKEVLGLGFKFCKVDVDKNREIMGAHDVTSMPTIVLLYKGKELDRIKGANMQALHEAINKHYLVKWNDDQKA